MLGRVTASQIAAASAASFFAPLAREAVGGDELRGHEAYRVAVGLEEASPVVGTGARLHADQARRQRRDRLQQFAAWHAGAHQQRPARGIHTMQGKHVLGEIDT